MADSFVIKRVTGGREEYVGSVTGIPSWTYDVNAAEQYVSQDHANAVLKLRVWPLGSPVYDLHLQ
jgi:hypothetical protein